MQTTRTTSRNGAKTLPPVATKGKPAPVATKPKVGNPNFGKQALSDDEVLARIKANRKAQQKRNAERKAMKPVARATAICESAIERLASAEKYLTRFDADGLVQASMNAIASQFEAIVAHLGTLPEDFEPSRSRGVVGPRRTYATGSLVYIKSKVWESYQKHFAAQGPLPVIETTEDGEFVMLQGQRFAIGVHRGDVSPLTPAEQEKASAERAARRNAE